MAIKVSDMIDSLRINLARLEDHTGKKVFADALFPDPHRLLATELRLAQRICSCVEMFFLQDFVSESEENEEELDSRDDWVSSFRVVMRLVHRICSRVVILQRFASESEESEQDQSLESFYDRVGVAINEKAREIYSACQEMNRGEVEYDKLVSSFHDVMGTLEPLLRKAAEKCMHSSQSKHCTTEKLLEFIQLVSEDVKEFHPRSSLDARLLQKLEFLKILIRFAASRGVGQDKLQDLLAHAEVVVTTTAYWSYVRCKPAVVGRGTWSVISSRYSKMTAVPLDVHETYIRVLRASRSSCSSDYSRMDDYNIVEAFMDSLLETHRQLLASNSSFKVSVMKMLIEELRFLRNSIIYWRQEGEDPDEQMTNLICDVISEAGIVIYSLSWYYLRENSTRELGFSNWMEKVQLLNKVVAKRYPETSRYKFPRINEVGFMDGLLKDLKELIWHNPDSIAFARGQMDVVMEDLVFLRDFLHDMVKQRNKHEELKALWIRVVDVAYETEFVINSLVVGDPSPDCSPTSFNAIKEEIKKIKTEVKEMYKENRYKIEAMNAKKVSNHLPSRSSNPTMDEVIVGFEDEAEKIIDRLKAKSAPLDIVSIVGMPGQGKTTLAKKVYNDGSIRSHFHLCAWGCVSQGYQKRKLLLDILRGAIDELPNGISEMNDEDLEQVLYRSLKGRRYLVVLDDIWDIEAWRDLQLSFPNDHNQSRILLTSRILNVALQAKRNSNPHFLRLLNDAESRELLQKKLLHNKGFPAKLRYVGTQVTKICRGSPLAVVTVAGILATMEQDSWEDFAKCLSTALVSGADQCVELLELSYIHLPDYLKPCLLYFGSFLHYQEIPVSRLMWLWMAEGFVQKTTDEKSLENLAEDYLIDLINRSLVMVVKQTSRGGIKVCSVHDLVHQFCVTKAKEENFMQLLNLQKEPGPISEPRRLCIYSWKDHQCFRRISSLKLFYIDGNAEIPSILRSFKLLKVLVLRGISCDDFPAEVKMLVHLRYLALVGHITSIPSTIANLWNLETFLLRGLRGEISLPYTLLNMIKLRHLHVNNRVVFSLPEENIEKCHESSNLETFSTPLLSSGQDMVKIIRKIPHIQKLKCTFLGSRDSKEGYRFPALNFLGRLESLKVHSTGKVRYRLEFSLPLSLKKLTLSNFYLPWASISRFSKLPNLEVLKLLNKACEGHTWDMGAVEEFSKLRFLKLENLDIIHWNACSDNFPRLRRLVLHKCKKLQGIPSDVEDITTLEIIEVKWCHDSVVASAQTMERNVEGLKAFIHASPVERS